MQSHLAKSIAFVFLLGAGVVKSQTLNWASLTGSAIVDSDGGALNNTFVFQLGAFDPDFEPIESNIGEWAANWQVFDTADYAYDVASQTGYFTGTQSLQNVPDYPTMFQGLTAYLWIRNGAHTEYFLASAAAKPGVDPWKFPELDPGCCPTGVTTWSISDLGDDSPIWGSQGNEVGGGNFVASGPFDIQTHSVPEPGAWLFLLLVAPLVSLRRRR